MLHALAGAAGRNMVLFALVDDHVHLVVIVDPVNRFRVQGALTKVLNHRSATPFGVPNVKPVESREHMKRLVGYLLTQNEHHGIPGDPATLTGSCFADLAGARRIPGMALRIGAALPRFRTREAYAVVGLADELTPATDEQVRGLGPHRLADFVAQTFAVGPALLGNTPTTARARRVCVRLGVDVGMRAADMALPLGITATAAARLAKRAVDDADLCAVRLRITLEFAAAGRPRRPNIVREADRPVYQPRPTDTPPASRSPSSS